MEMTQFAMVEELALLVKDDLFCKHLVLSTEEAFVDFMQTDMSADGILELEPMNPYHRLLVHRLAEIFGFAHGSVGEGDDRHLVVQRCSESLMPPIFVSDILWQYDECHSTMKTHILRREPLPALKRKEACIPSITMEEREAAYMAARERIFALHVDDEKKPVATKPRNIPVVARRMITHALGRNILSITSNQNISSKNCEEHGSPEELTKGKEGNLSSTGQRTKSAQKMQKKGQLHGTYEVRNGSSHDSRVKMEANGKEPSNCSQNTKVTVVKGNGRIGCSPNLEREQFGAARRMFAHALGLPSAKGLHSNEPIKALNNQ